MIQLQLRRQKFQRDVAVQIGIVRQVQLAHTTFAKLAADMVVSKDLADEGGPERELGHCRRSETDAKRQLQLPRRSRFLELSVGGQRVRRKRARAKHVIDFRVIRAVE